ncbi:MAG: SCE4755 family polysaccharide monooxygenase-like protein [Kofleriaceae bacterium]
MKRVGAASFLAVIGLSSSAFAHIHLTNPLSRTDNAQGNPQKNGHCGDPAYSRAANPTRTTVYPPGATITVTWAETIPHPGWFRISFQPNGDTFALPRTGTGVGNFQSPLESEEGLTDAAGALVIADLIPDGTLSREITLPNVECANCTLQFIQVMTGAMPYERVATEPGNNDLYFNCADITLQAGATMPPDPPVGDDAGTGGGGDDAGVGNPGGPGEVTGGCSAASSSAGALLGLVLLVGLRRRRN